MFHKVKPENFEKEINNNLVVGRYGEKTIVMNEIGALFYLPGEAGELELGTYVGTEGLLPLDGMDITELTGIIEMLQKQENQNGK